VVPGEVAGGFTATEFVLRHGHRRVAFVNGEPWMEAARDRLKGYRQALASADAPFDAGLVRSGDWMPDSGYRHAYDLLAGPRPPTAIVCANDLMALGVLEALAELGLRAPDDVSVMGYDDQEMARYTRPALSTCILPNYEMGRWAAETVIAQARGPARPLQIKMECPLVPRETVAAPCPDLADALARVSARLARGPGPQSAGSRGSWSLVASRLRPEAEALATE
jgi:LacI family transcriptional regulator